MAFIADLHLHSRFARACSKDLTLANNTLWAKIKGIDVLVTGDFTHHAWFQEIQEQLIEVDEGMYELSKSYTGQISPQLRERTKALVQSWKNRKIEEPRFILGTEVSLIYKKGDRVRKIHHLVLAPNIQVAARINETLSKRGNLNADGRPILDLDSKELLKILLDISQEIELIPAHAWTPHFGIFGSKTGLSSDPPMNERLSRLDSYALISCSDAHSSAKMGREATVFNGERTYSTLLHALRNDHHQIAGTIEFFPEEGKYYYDGLRNENLVLKPEETKCLHFLSPNTGRKVTVGVLHRVMDLADRPAGFRHKTARLYWSLIPLDEILSEMLDSSVGSQKVRQKYFQTLAALGPELFILKDCPLSAIEDFDLRLAEGIARLRQGDITLKPGYDGVYGKVMVFGEKKTKQSALF